ncbi:hypothetical protein [Sinomonas susongensis]|uniref:hypothetical protein n=1 Tax=Sinomonas susongensis TaxID=1324851 RepID=UPI001107DABD|nr:hypothetical protein [Sinomonas susongensis]
MQKMTKKAKATLAVATAGMLSVGGAAAFAYWTTTGTGGGNAAASAGGGTVTIHANFDQGIAPGTSKDVTYTADNGNASSTVVGTLTPTVTTSNAQCLPAWFTATANTANVRVAANASGTQVGTGTLTFADTVDNQDACKGATITITVASN